MSRWVHPDVVSRAPPISLAVVAGLLAFDFIAGWLFHHGGGAAMGAVEVATAGWIHHSLAWGAITSAAFAALAVIAGVRLRHLGLDRRELRRWIATFVVGWCAVQLVVIALAQLGVIAALRMATTAPASIGIVLALLIHTGLFEEVLARGIVLPVLVRRFGVAAGLGLAALAFALGHLPVVMQEHGSATDTLFSLAQYWWWAVCDGVLYLRSGSLLTLAAFHALHDWPTPFAIDSRLFSTLYVAIYVGAAVYVWLHRWTSTSSKRSQAGSTSETMA